MWGRTLIRLGLAIASAAMASAAIAAGSAPPDDVAPLGSTIGLGATAVALPPGGPQSFDADAQSQGATLNPLSASVLATDSGTTFDFGDVFVMTAGAATASWTSAASGIVEFDQVGWTVSNGTSASLHTNELWEYEFQLNRPSIFSVDVDIDLTGTNTAGIGTYVFRILGQGGVVHERFFGDNRGTSTSFSQQASLLLDPAAAYTAQIRGVSGIAGVVLTRTAYKDARFAFDIVEVSAIPEPSSVLMLGLGFTAVLGALRRTTKRQGRVGS